MKKIFLALLLLTGLTGLAQTTGYFRYDTVRIQKVGGSSTLIIENSTKNVTGGVLTNVGGGRTAFVTPAAGGGSSDSTLQLITDNVGGNTTTKGITVGKRDSVGTVFSYFMPTNPISGTTATDNTATATLSTTGSQMTITGTAARNLNNFVDFPTVKVGADNFTVTWTAVCRDSILSQGIALALIPGGTAASMMAHYIICPDSLSYINYTSTVTTPSTADLTNKDKANFRVVQGDTVQFTFQRRSRTGVFSMYDKQTQAYSELKLVNTIFAGVGNLRLYDYGGTWDFVDSFKIKYDEHYAPDIMHIADSWGYGGGAKTEYEGLYYVSTSGYRAVREAGSGETSAQAINRFGDIVTFHPRIAVWFIGINDLNGSGTGPGAGLDSFCKRTIRFIDLCQSIGTIPVLSTLGPQVTDAHKYNDSVYAIASRRSVLVIKRYENLKHPTQVYMDDKFVSNDPVHPNSYGHRFEGLFERKEYDSLLRSVTPATPLKLEGIPKTSAYDGLVVLRNGNEVATALQGSLNEYYIVNQPLVNSTVNPQIANQFTDGTNWGMGPEFRWSPDGTSITANPYVKWDINEQKFQALTSKNGTTVGGHWVFDGSISGSTDEIGLLNNIKFQPNLYPFKILAKGITTSKNAFSVNNVSATVPVDDSIAAFHVNDSAYIWFDRFGGIRARYNSGYTTSMDYTLLGNNDWPTKRHVDSLIALAVAGAGGVTGFTDGGGFDGTITSSNLSLLTQYNKGQVMFARNDHSMNGNDSLAYISGQLLFNYYHTTLPQLRVGDIGLTAFSLNNYWIGPIYYSSGFKYIVSGSYAPHIYFNAGSIDLNITTATGSAGSAATVLTALHVDRTAGNTGILISTPREALDVNGAISVRTVNLGTSVDSMFTYENGRLTAINATNWGRTASTGITNTSGTWTANLSTGVSGGQSAIFGTAANDQGIIRGSTASSGSTTTNPDISFIAGDGAGITAAQVIKNGAVNFRYISGTTSIGSVTPSTGAGTSPTVAATGTDIGGYISITTGTSPANAATIATVAFGNSYPSAPRSIILTPANSATAALSGVTMVYVDQTSISTANFSLTSGPTGLTGATAYKWYYQVIQ